MIPFLVSPLLTSYPGGGGETNIERVMVYSQKYVRCFCWHTAVRCCRLHRTHEHQCAPCGFAPASFLKQRFPRLFPEAVSSNLKCRPPYYSFKRTLISAARKCKVFFNRQENYIKHTVQSLPVCLRHQTRVRNR